MIFNENYDYLYNVLAGTGAEVRQRYERRRFNRAMLALKCQNWFQWVTFTNTTGLAGVTATSVSDVLEKPLIVRGGGMNSFIPNEARYWVFTSLLSPINVKLSRAGSNRAQINLEFLRSSHLFSQGNGQKYSLNWPIPWVLFPNEAIRVDFSQEVAVTANTIYNIGFYGLSVDPNFRCSSVLLDDIRTQISKTTQYPRYIHIKSDVGAGTLTYPSSIETDPQQIFANTIEVPENMLILGIRRARVDIKDDSAAAIANTTLKLVVAGGPVFSKVEIPVNAIEMFSTPDAGYFSFTVPHFLPRGSSIGMSITAVIDNLEKQYAGEIELLCVTV